MSESIKKIFQETVDEAEKKVFMDYHCFPNPNDEGIENGLLPFDEPTQNDVKEIFTEVEDPQPVQKCRVCGCTQERACPGGCYWVEPDLCSSCVDEQIEISIGYFKYADESSDRVQILETIGLACDFNSVEEAEAFIHGYATALGLESAFENEAEKYPCQTIEFVVIVNGNYITGLEFYYEGEINECIE